MQGRNHTAWKQNPTITIMFHESIAILLKNAPFFEVPYWLLPACSKETKRRVAFFPGSTIGNFSPREVQDWFGLLRFNIPGKTLN
jgi:uncharacterized SAM-dependent methyltransferase